MYPSNLYVMAVVLVAFVVELTVNAWLLTHGIGAWFLVTLYRPISVDFHATQAVIHDSHIHGQLICSKDAV